MMSNTGILDETKLRRQVFGDAEFLTEQLELFREYYPNQLAQIRGAIDREDATQLREWAHQLSGSLSSFHASASRDTAKAIEACGKENRLAEAAPLYPRLEKQVEELCGVVEQLVENF
jgi:HPt (histidine-containing phosphotransfer) domain-containing protein